MIPLVIVITEQPSEYHPATCSEKAAHTRRHPDPDRQQNHVLQSGDRLLRTQAAKTEYPILASSSAS
jgi:hypothetical protein